MMQGVGYTLGSSGTFLVSVMPAISRPSSPVVVCAGRRSPMMRPSNITATRSAPMTLPLPRISRILPSR